MPNTNWNIPWSVQNSQRKYPLTSDSTAVDDTGSFEIPDDFIVGMSLPVHAGLDVDPSKFYVKSIGAYETGYAIVVGYSGASEVEVATTWVNRAPHSRNDSYALGGVGDFSDTVGRIVIGRFDNIDAQPTGVYNFTLATARISTDVTRPIVRGISSISVVNGSEVSGPYYGDIELVAQENMQITASAAVGEPTEIRFSAIEGEGLAEDCVCDGDVDAPCIKRINGIPATADNDFILLGSTCLTITGIENGITLTDVCSEPCCGCDELEDITRDLERFGSEAVTLRNFMVNLESRVTQMDMVVLGSKLSDRGCFECP